MCTKPRIIVPAVFYEITSKGVHNTKIFPDNEMKTFFLKELSLTLKKFSFQCFAWSIMDDHYHLIVKSSNFSISSFMQRLNSNYARYFNKKTGRKGVVFYRRFSSVITQEKNGLEELIRYVFLNPVRCGDCTINELDHYQWSGHRALVNNVSDDILNVKEILNKFGGSDSLATYCNFVKSGSEDCKIIQKVRTAHDGGQYFSDPQCWIIGDETFTQNIIDKDQCRRIRIARYVKENVTINAVLKKIKNCIDLKHTDILFHGRLNEISTARQMFAIVGHCYFEFSCSSLARFLKVTSSAVSRMISRGKRITGLDYLSEMICIA